MLTLCIPAVSFHNEMNRPLRRPIDPLPLIKGFVHSLCGQIDTLSTLIKPRCIGHCQNLN